MTEWVEYCVDAPVIAVDTESDSFHHYREKVCLIQMTARGVDAIIDPLALESLEPLAPMFADPKRTKIFHDAGYDLICLGRDFNFRVQGAFDTMLASRLLGEKTFGLAAILKERFGHDANKRLQRSDWTRRPLTEEQISYARYDTHFLPELTRMLTDELKKAGRWAWAQEEFARLPAVAERLVMRRSGPDKEGFWRIRGIRTLSPEIQGRIRTLYLARERLAERLDRPPFKVFGDSVLVDLARHPPRSLKSFSPRPGLRRTGIDRFGREIIKAIEGATPVTERPPRGVRARRRAGRFLDPKARDRFEALRALRKTKAAEHDIDPDVAIGNATLEDLARKPPTKLEQVLQIPELSGWRGLLFAEEIFDTVRKGASRAKNR